MLEMAYSHATLYTTLNYPTWSEHIVSYLTLEKIANDIPKHYCQDIEVDAQVYSLSESQFYRMGMDVFMQLCINESKYIPLLHQAHSGDI